MLSSVVKSNMMKYKFLEDLTSDVAFEAYGKTLKELLENAALAMFSVVCDIKHIEPKKSMKIELSSDSREDLLYDWLSKLLSQSEINNLFLSKFEVQKINHLKLLGIAYGEPMSQEKSGTVVKGVTYHGFSIKETSAGYKARVTLDI